MPNYKILAILITIINCSSLVYIPLLKYILNSHIPYGYNKETYIFYIIVLYILEIFCIPFSIANYKNLVKNNLTTHSKAKQLYACLTPILTFIAIVLLGIFVK